MSETIIKSLPAIGGMNQDDDPKYLPENDYIEARNLTKKRGVAFIEKINSSNDVETQILGDDCIGYFDLLDRAVLFTHESSNNYLRIYIQNSEESVELIFEDNANYGDTEIIECKIVHNEILLINNGVDEILKIHIDMAKMTIFYNDDPLSDQSGEFTEGTIGTEDGYLTFTRLSGVFDTNTNSLFFVGKPTDTKGSLSDFSPLVNRTIFGYLKNNTTFVSEIRTEEGNGFEGETWYVKPPISKDIKSGYRKTYWKDYTLINVPPLDPPEINFTNNSNINKNNISSDAYQFRCYYVYEDNSVSALSPYSEMLTIVSDPIQPLSNNSIIVQTKNPTSYGVGSVKEVVFCFRKNEGDLYEFDRIPIIKESAGYFGSNGGIASEFTSQSVPVLVDPIRARNKFDWIFPKTNSVDFFGTGRTAMGGVYPLQRQVESNVEVLANTRLIDASEPSGHIVLFTYFGDIYYSLSNQFSGVYTNLDAVQLFVKNRTYYNLVIGNSPSASELNSITQAYSNIIRYREANSNKTHAFIQFSDNQDVGTRYKIKVIGNARHPKNYNFNGNIFTIERVFTVKDPDSQVLVDEIRDWFKNQSSFAYGKPGNYIEFFSFNQNETSGGKWWNAFTPPAGKKSLVLSAGLQAGGDTSAYHWFQVKEMIVYVDKITYKKSNQKVMKRDASHRFLLEYVDEFGRLLGNAPLDSLNLQGNTSQNVESIFDGVKLRLYHDPPLNAKRCHLLYAGNSNYSRIISVIGKSVTPSGNKTTVNIETGLTQFNNENGATLSYEFVDGDQIMRVKSFDSGTSQYSNLTTEDTSQMRIISQDISSGTIEVERNLLNDIEENDLLLILRPKKTTEDSDTLFYETGKTIKIENNTHIGVLSKGGSSLININLSNTYFEKVTYNNFTDRVFIKFPISLLKEIFLYETVSITNFVDDLFGEHDIIQKYMDSNPHSTFGVGVLIDLVYDDTFWGGLTSEPISLLWNAESAQIVNSGTSNPYSEITFDGIGDCYYRYRSAPYETNVESFSMLDFKDLTYWGKGRPSLVIKNFDLKFIAHVYYSEPYYTQTNVNGISTVYSTNFESYTEEGGQLVRILENMGLMYLFFENLTGYVGVGKTELSTTKTGSTINVESDIVLSPVVKFTNKQIGIGSQKYSLHERNGLIAFADDINNTICVLSGDKIIEIGRIKMNSYFTKNVVNNNRVKILTDVDNSYLMVHIIGSGDLNEVVLYSLEDQRWKFINQYDSEFLVFYRKLYSYTQSKIIGYGGSSKLVFPSGTKEASIKIPFNKNDVYKIWNSMMVDDQFIDGDTDIIQLTTDNGQESNLIKEDFRQRGSGKWASFRRDTNTDVNLPLINGERLRSRLLTIEIKSTSTNDKKIDRVMVYCSPRLP